MFVKVTKKFKDKYTNEVRNQGDVFECTDARFAEIQEAGKRAGKCYAMRLEEKEGAGEDAAVGVGKAPEGGAEAASAPGKALEDMSARELREYADKAHKLTFGAKASKAEMIEAIRRAEK